MGPIHWPRVNQKALSDVTEFGYFDAFRTGQNPRKPCECPGNEELGIGIGELAVANESENRVAIMERVPVVSGKTFSWLKGGALPTRN